jgi:hypothetical protein
VVVEDAIVGASVAESGSQSRPTTQRETMQVPEVAHDEVSAWMGVVGYIVAVVDA